ncbi:hypothetical protein GCM10027093_41790 [Paraburkholderia jirisanensis]
MAAYRKQSRPATPGNPPVSARGCGICSDLTAALERNRLPLQARAPAPGLAATAYSDSNP